MKHAHLVPASSAPARVDDAGVLVMMSCERRQLAENPSMPRERTVWPRPRLAARAAAPFAAEVCSASSDTVRELAARMRRHHPLARSDPLGYAAPAGRPRSVPCGTRSRRRGGWSLPPGAPRTPSSAVDGASFPRGSPRRPAFIEGPRSRPRPTHARSTELSNGRARCCDWPRAAWPLLRICLSWLLDEHSPQLALSRRASRGARVMADRVKLSSGERLRRRSWEHQIRRRRRPAEPPSSGAPSSMPRGWCEQDVSTSSTSRRAAGSIRGEPRIGIARGPPADRSPTSEQPLSRTVAVDLARASPHRPPREGRAARCRPEVLLHDRSEHVSLRSRLTRAGHPASRSNAGLAAGTFGSLPGASPTR